MVPIRALSDALYFDVEWFAEKKTVDIMLYEDYFGDPEEAKTQQIIAAQGFEKLCDVLNSSKGYAERSVGELIHMGNGLSYTVNKLEKLSLGSESYLKANISLQLTP